MKKLFIVTLCTFSLALGIFNFGSMKSNKVAVEDQKTAPVMYMRVDPGGM
ncbi:hypothetical protein QRE66_08665 [Bacillus cereus]|nr:hypothetical protein QRE66_08665 [Bacillus cereus]